MIDTVEETTIKTFLAAVRRAIDPHRTLLAASTPYVVAGSIGAAVREAIVAGTLAADIADADYIHLEFEPGATADGPVNVIIGMVRAGVCHIRESCRFWMGEDGEMSLVATVGSKAATMTFGGDGTDSHPGLPAGDLAQGYSRAAGRLRDLAGSSASTGACVTIRLAKAA